MVDRYRWALPLVGIDTQAAMTMGLLRHLLDCHPSDSTSFFF